MLEAFGDDYSAFGHARHLHLHRPPDRASAGPATRSSGTTTSGIAHRRRQDALHDHDAAAARPLLARYGIDYVVVGPIEQTTYGDAGVAKWDQLGRRVYSRQGTTVWESTR